MPKVFLNPSLLISILSGESCKFMGIPFKSVSELVDHLRKVLIKGHLHKIILYMLLQLKGI